MAKKQNVPVDQKILATVVKKVETKLQPKNRSELWAVVTEVYNKMPDIPAPITPSIANLRVAAWGIEVTTPVGKKGALTEEHKRAMKEGRSSAGGRRSRSAKMQADPLIVKSLELMRNNPYIPDRYLPLIEKIANGSRKAAGDLHCLECVGWSPKDVRNCTGLACPMYPIRPYQHTPDDQIETALPEGDDEEESAGEEPQAAEEEAQEADAT